MCTKHVKLKTFETIWNVNKRGEKAIKWIYIHGRMVTKLCTSMPGTVCISEDNVLSYSRLLGSNSTKWNKERVNNKQTPGCIRVGMWDTEVWRKVWKDTQYTWLWTKLEMKSQEGCGKQAKKKRKLNYIEPQHICYDLIYYMHAYVYMYTNLEKEIISLFRNLQGYPWYIKQKQKQQINIYTMNLFQ